MNRLKYLFVATQKEVPSTQEIAGSAAHYSSPPQWRRSDMKKLKLIKDGELAVSKDGSIYCDFCGENNVEVFTSSFDDRKDGDERKCETQICINCIKQLHKLI